MCIVNIIFYTATISMDILILNVAKLHISYDVGNGRDVLYVSEETVVSLSYNTY